MGYRSSAHMGYTYPHDGKGYGTTIIPHPALPSETNTLANQHKIIINSSDQCWREKNSIAGTKNALWSKFLVYDVSKRTVITLLTATLNCTCITPPNIQCQCAFHWYHPLWPYILHAWSWSQQSSQKAQRHLYYQNLQLDPNQIWRENRHIYGVIFGS